MYIFNPEHDLCIANGDIHFVPPDSALAFGRDCASLVRLMEGLDAEADSAEGAGAPVEKILPWGWNSVLCDRLRKQGIPQSKLPSEEQLRSIVELSHRKLAHTALEYLCENPSMAEIDENSDNQLAALIGHDYRIAAGSLEQVELFLKKNPHIVLKAPLSGSGKGIRFVSEKLSHSDAGWCRNLIAKHGYVVAEKRMLPLLEFAMLYKTDGCGGVNFLGYSLFWSENGAYRGNVLASNDFIKGKIEEYLPSGMVERVEKLLEEFLKTNVAGKYEGFVGVDQFICRDPYGLSGAVERLLYNPVVEINLRMTMGLVARNIYDNFAPEFGLQQGSHIFEICRNIPEKGRYSYRIAKTFVHL